MKTIVTLVILAASAVFGRNTYKSDILAFIDRGGNKSQSLPYSGETLQSANVKVIENNTDLDDATSNELDGTNNPANRNTEEVASIKIED